MLPKENTVTDMCKISVIVPVYNVERDIKRCIASILAQTFSDFELLLINDGSPDNSGALCKEAAETDRRIRYFEKPNGGLASARNYGLKNAKGEFICFVDSDDYIEPECLEFCFNSINKTTADIVLCGYLMENGKSVSKIAAEPELLNRDNINQKIKELKIKNLIDPAWNKLYRRSFIEQSGITFPEGEIYEDTDFNLRLLKFSPIIAVYDNCFYHYMLNMGSITRRYNTEKITTIKRRALLLKEVTSGIDAYCDFYYIKSVFSAIMDMFLSCDKKLIKKAILFETKDKQFISAAKNAEALGISGKFITRAAQSLKVSQIYRFCLACYILKYRLQKLFLRVR